MWEEVEKLSTSYLKKTVASLKKQGVNIISKVLKAQTGEVAQTIMHISKEEKIDLIIISTQGRTGVSGWVYGSVANKIMKELPQPVLLVRPSTSIPVSAPQNLLDDIWQGYIAGKI